MNTQNNTGAGSVTLDGGAGNPPGGGGQGGQGQPPPAGDVLAGLQNADNRKFVETKGWKALDDIVTSTRQLETKLGTSITLPGADAKPEDWEAFYNRTGRPEKPDGYTFAPPKDMPADVPYNADFATWFRAEAHKSGLPDRSAKALHDSFVTYSVNAAKKAGEDAVKTANDALVKAYGPLESETFKTAVDMMNRGIKALGGDELLTSLKNSGFLGPQGQVLDPVIAKALERAGRALGSEAGLGPAGGGGAGAGGMGANPFDPKTENVTEQHRLIKRDRPTAERLMRAVGKAPADYGLT